MTAMVITSKELGCEVCVDFDFVDEVPCTCGGRLLLGFDATTKLPVVFHNSPECDLFMEYLVRDDVVGFVRKIDEQLTQTLAYARARVRGQGWAGNHGCLHSLS